MKNKIVLIPFPFDDFTTVKIRPALCLTDKIGKYNHVVVAFITSQVATGLSKSDILIDKNKSYFNKTGLKVSSAVRLHRIVTIPESFIQRELGKLPLEIDRLVKMKLKELFEL